VARAFRRFHRPVITLGAVQLPEKQVVLRPAFRKPPKHVVRGIESVMNEDVALVTARVVTGQENAVGIGRTAGLQVAVNRLDERERAGSAGQREVRVDDCGVAGDVRGERRGIGELAGRHRHHGRLGDACTRRREQRDPVAERREPPHQRHHDALRAAVTLRRQRLMGGHDDVHAQDKITSSTGCRTRRRHSTASGSPA
jgi:hypothetical protein